MQGRQIPTVFRQFPTNRTPFLKKLTPSFAKVNAAPESICYSSRIYKKRRFYAAYTNF